MVFVRRRDRGEELGASTEEQLLEGRDGSLLAALHGGELVPVVLLDEVHDSIIRRSGAQGRAHSQERVHPLALLGDRTVLVTPGVVLLHPVEEDQHRDEDLDGIGVSSEGHVSESDVVEGGDVTSSDFGQEGVVAKVHVLHGLKGDCDASNEGVLAAALSERLSVDAHGWGLRGECVPSTNRSGKSNPSFGTKAWTRILLQARCDRRTRTSGQHCGF